MNTQQLVDLARVLIWPLALVVLAIVFRQPISRLLVTITQLRFRGLEIDFGRQLERLRAKLPPVSGAKEDPVEAGAQIPNPAPDGLAEEVASAQPVASVLLAWTALEARIKERAGVEHPASLPPELEALIKGLSELSEAAAGGRIKGGAPSAEQARAYGRLTDRAGKWLDSLR